MGAAPMALPRQAGAARIVMGIPTQPFRAGLTLRAALRASMGAGPEPIVHSMVRLTLARATVAIHFGGSALSGF